ncbi:uncharacterized protein LOC144370744 [Ictidomys tridecemlineatus]
MDRVRRDFAVVEEMTPRDPKNPAMPESERIHFPMDPSSSKWTTLTLSKEQVETLEKYVRKYPFPSNSTLQALASRLGLEEQLVQRLYRLKNSFGGPPKPSCPCSNPTIWVGASWSTYFLICPSCKRDHTWKIRPEAPGKFQGYAQDSSWPQDEAELEEVMRRLSTAAPEHHDLGDTDESGPGDF